MDGKGDPTGDYARVDVTRGKRRPKGISKSFTYNNMDNKRTRHDCREWELVFI